jgi:hypothetical protein
VRGIIQLEILESIASRVGHNIPIQEFFDIIVGTGTGELPSKLKWKWLLNTARGNYLSWNIQERMANSGGKREIPCTNHSSVLETLITQTSMAITRRLHKRANDAQLSLQK